MKNKLIARLSIGLFLFVLAGTASATTISTDMTVDNGFDFYLSTDDTAKGTLVGSGDNWQSTYSFDSLLTSGTDYYLHVVASDWGVVAGFIGDFTLSDSSFLFANGTQSLLTNTTDWSVYTDSFGGTLATTTEATYDWGTVADVDESADWIWTNNGYDLNTTIYFSAAITSVEPIAITTSLHPTPEPTNPVPEPTTMLLFGLGLLGVAGIARRKSN